MMKKSVKQVVIISSLVLVLLLAFAIYKNNANSKSDDSSYRQQLELYLEAAKESPQKSSEYAYFPTEVDSTVAFCPFKKFKCLLVEPSAICVEFVLYLTQQRKLFSVPKFREITEFGYGHSLPFFIIGI